MTAEISNGVRVCGDCEHLIQAGDPVYFVTIAKQIRCETCAKKFRVPLPQPITVDARRELPRPIETFPRAKIAAQVRKNILDFRAKQAQADV